MMVVMDQMVPDRSLDQRMSALLLANETRVKRSELKLNVKAGRLQAVDVLRDPPAYAASMKVIDVLLAVPKLGRVKVNNALWRATISPSKTLGGLSPRQCGELVAWLEGRS